MKACHCLVKFFFALLIKAVILVKFFYFYAFVCKALCNTDSCKGIFQNGINLRSFILYQTGFFCKVFAVLNCNGNRNQKKNEDNNCQFPTDFKQKNAASNQG